MSATPETQDLDSLRRHVRGTQHARSFPLLVIGGLLVNYAVTDFSSNPVAWRYGAPLAFVLVWALGKVNEQLVGVGAARGDYLAAAGAVFIATNTLLFVTHLVVGTNFNELVGAWVIIVGIALAVLSRAGRDPVLGGAGCVVISAGIVMAVFGSVNFDSGLTTWTYFARSWSILLLAAVGAALGLAGLLLYRSERTDP
jgi:hypothetical protein